MSDHSACSRPARRRADVVHCRANITIMACPSQPLPTHICALVSSGALTTHGRESQQRRCSHTPQSVLCRAVWTTSQYSGTTCMTSAYHGLALRQLLATRAHGSQQHHHSDHALVGLICNVPSSTACACNIVCDHVVRPTHSWRPTRKQTVATVHVNSEGDDVDADADAGPMPIAMPMPVPTTMPMLCCD